MALSTDTTVLTALANDYGYPEVFARQVQAHGRPGDALVGLSTSGRSANVLRALEAARDLGLVRIALTGRRGGPVADAAQHCFRAPAEETPRIQECHILAGHVMCEIAEAWLLEGP
jgi:D-sedoheptulose 7-phosphate isomerase